VSLRSRTLVATGVLAAVLAGPVAARAAVKSVDMGVPKSAQKTLNEQLGSDVNDYFPHTVTVRVGDRVRFVPSGFHTVDLVPRGASLLPLFVPGQAVSGATDAAGNPFWFNGQPNLGFNPPLLAMLYGKRATFDGSRRVNSGVPLGSRLKPFTVRFTKAGTYTYLCDVHPGMKGKVRVVASGRPVPSARADARAVTRQLASAIRTAKRLARTTAPSGVVNDGVAGPHGVEYFQFVPSKITVPAGTTLTFRMTKGSYETHTATTGPGNPEKEPTSYLGKLTASFEAPTLDPAGAYPSDPPGAPTSLTPGSHGNGFWNSGTIDLSRATPPPESNSVTFAQAGTYEFYCLIHPFMHATVTVT
jgi:plastocyanin